MKYLYTPLILLASSLFFACSPMDDTYKEFIKEGPIIYLTKMPVDSIYVQSGWNKAKLTFAKLDEPRAKSILIKWANEQDSIRIPYNTDGPTEVMIDPMREGSVIFSCLLAGEDGNKSLTTDVSTVVYGDTYKSYLSNRAIKGQALAGNDLVLSYGNLSDSTAVAAKITWYNNGDETTEIFEFNADNKIILENITGKSFRIQTIYLPAPTALETVTSEETTYYINYLIPRDNWKVGTSHKYIADGTIGGEPEKMIDGDEASGLSLNKPGKPGVPAGDKVFFTLDLGKEYEFNYFIIVHRTSMLNIGLRLWGASFYGSYDGLNYDELIQEDVDIPYDGINKATVKFNESHKYRYIKVLYTKYSTTQNNAVQIHEFYLGLNYEQ